MAQIKEKDFNNIISDFIRVSQEVECSNCGKITKLIGERRANGNWICPVCFEYYPYKEFTNILEEVPFVKLTTQLQQSQPRSSILLGDPVTVDFPMDLFTGFLVPSYSSDYQIKRKQNRLNGQAIDFTRFGRIKSGVVWQFTLGYDDRQVSEYETLASFAETQGNHLPFNYTDPFRGSSHICYFESDISPARASSFDGVSFSIEISE